MLCRALGHALLDCGAACIAGKLRYGAFMPVCKACGEEVESLVSVKVDGKAKKVCEDCAELASEQSAIAEQSESVVQQMMGYKGRR
jgi:ribosome-binding protein aMBF1 (putative translation factor)